MGDWPFYLEQVFPRTQTEPYFHKFVHEEVFPYEL